MPELETEWLTTRQAAAQIGCGHHHVAGLCRAGRLIGSLDTDRHGREAWLVDAASVAAYRPKKRGWTAGKSRAKETTP